MTIATESITPKEQLIQAIDDIPDALIIEVLDFLYFLKMKQLQDNQDLQDAHEALLSAKNEGTVPWNALKTEVGL